MGNQVVVQLLTIVNATYLLYIKYKYIADKYKSRSVRVLVWSPQNDDKNRLFVIGCSGADSTVHI